MVAKKIQKKPQKSSGNTIKKLKSIGAIKGVIKEPIHTTIETGPSDPEKLKPRWQKQREVLDKTVVVDKLPEGFKTADRLTMLDELEFEMARLRNLLITWMDIIEYKGKTYYFVIDPLNQKIIEFSDEPLTK